MLQVYLQTYKSLAPGGADSVDLVFGSALHKFAEHWHKTGDNVMAQHEAIKFYNGVEKYTNAKNKHKNVPLLIEACNAYERAWLVKRELKSVKIVEDNGKPLVEYKFSIPYYSTDEFDIVLCGTIDQITCVDGRTYIINDIKTSTAYDRETYLNSYGMSSQLMIYRMALEWHAREFPDSIYATMLKGTIGCRILGVFCGANKNVEVELSDIYWYPDSLVEEAKKVIKQKVDILIDHIKSGTRPLKEGIITGACYDFKRCPYFNACNSRTDREMDNTLESQMVKKHYDPMLFR